MTPDVTAVGSTDAGNMDVRGARRRLAVDILGIGASAAAFGLIFGLAARQAGYSLVEAVAMSTIVFAGAAQFAAVGLVAAATPWPAIVLLTGLLNARHLLYSAALAPWLDRVPRLQKAAMAHLLTDEAFALSLAHFKRLGRADVGGYWIAAIISTFIPWNLATLVGFFGGQLIDDPARYGLDVVFPAAMGGLAVGLLTGRRELAACFGGIVVSIGVALTLEPKVAVVAGGLIGPLIGLIVPASPTSPDEALEPDPEAQIAFGRDARSGRRSRPPDIGGPP